MEVKFPGQPSFLTYIDTLLLQPCSMSACPNNENTSLGLYNDVHPSDLDNFLRRRDDIIRLKTFVLSNMYFLCSQSPSHFLQKSNLCYYDPNYHTMNTLISNCYKFPCAFLAFPVSDPDSTCCCGSWESSNIIFMLESRIPGITDKTCLIHPVGLDLFKTPVIPLLSHSRATIRARTGPKPQVWSKILESAPRYDYWSVR